MIDLEEYYEVRDCWVRWECEENYPTPYLRSINEHRHHVLPKRYNKKKWPGEFAGFEQGCKGTGRNDPEFLKHIEHAKFLHDKLPGGKPKPLIIGHHPSVFRPGAPRTWLSTGDKETWRTKLDYYWFRIRCSAAVWADARQRR